jgi:WD40 repeat protein
MMVSLGTACSPGSVTSQVNTPSAASRSLPPQKLTTPVLECTAPLCQPGEVFSCSSGNCPGGCGTTCVTVTPEYVTATPFILCTPPACQAGQALTCSQGDCPGGCGVSCEAPTATSQNATPQTPALPGFTLPGQGITTDNLSQLAELGKISEGPVNELAFSSDSSALALSTGNFAYIHDMTSLDLEASQQFNVPTSSIAFSPGGEQIAVAYGNAISLMPVDGSSPVPLATGLAQNVMITHLDLSPDGGTIAFASSDGAVNLFSLDQMSVQPNPVANPGPVDSLQYSPDSSFLAAGTEDGKLIVWNTTDWSEAKRVEGLASVKSVTFSPDATLLAAATKNSLIVWGTDTWDQKFSVPTNGDSALSVAFSPDGAFLAVGTTAGMIYIYNAATGQQLSKLTGHSGPVTSLAVSGDGLFLASGSADGTLRLWGIQ